MNYTIRSLAYALLTLFLFSFFSSTAFAQVENPNIKPIRFSLDSSFLNGPNSQTLEEIKLNLAGYVDDLNIIFGKTTSRQFSFDPETGIEFFNTPHTGGTCSLINSDYGYVAQIIKSNQDYSFGGNSGCNITNTNELWVFNMNWTRFYSRAEVESQAIPYKDYDLRQLYALTHELGHTHGLGIGEYYTLATEADNTGVLPDLSISSFNKEDDYYWKERLNVWLDPMLSGPPANTRLIDYAEFSPLSSTMIEMVASGDIFTTCGQTLFLFSHCFPLQADDSRVVNVVLEDQSTTEPIAGCEVEAYRHTASADGSFFITSSVTNASGTALLDLGNNLRHSNNDLLVFFKATCDSYAPAGDALSTFDLQAGLLMPNGGAVGDFHYSGNITIHLEPDDGTTPDTDGPQIVLTTPQPGQIFAPESVAVLSASITDQSGVSSVEYLTVGKRKNQSICSLPASTNDIYVCNWGTPRVKGNKQNSTAFVIIATDNLGNESTLTFDVVTAN